MTFENDLMDEGAWQPRSLCLKCRKMRRQSEYAYAGAKHCTHCDNASKKEVSPKPEPLSWMLR